MKLNKNTKYDLLINPFSYFFIKRWRQQRKEEMAREMRKRKEEEKRKRAELKADNFYKAFLLRLDFRNIFSYLNFFQIKFLLLV